MESRILQKLQPEESFYYILCCYFYTSKNPVPIFYNSMWLSRPIRYQKFQLHNGEIIIKPSTTHDHCNWLQIFLPPPFFPLARKTLTAIFIKILVANVLFPILLLSVHMARLVFGWGHFTSSGQRVKNEKRSISFFVLHFKHLIASVRHSKALYLPSGMTTGHIIYLSSQMAVISRAFPTNP